MEYWDSIKKQLGDMGLRMDDIRAFPVGVDHENNAVFRYTPLTQRKNMKAAKNENPLVWKAVPLRDATFFAEDLIGYCFKDGEIRWDAEFIIHHGLEGKPEIELPVHVLMYAPHYEKHLRKHLAYEKYKRASDQKRVVAQTQSPPADES